MIDIARYVGDGQFSCHARLYEMKRTHRDIAAIRYLVMRNVALVGIVALTACGDEPPVCNRDGGAACFELPSKAIDTYGPAALAPSGDRLRRLRGRLPPE